MMVLKLILPTICLVLLVHPVISDIGNKWTKTVLDIEKKLFKADFDFGSFSRGDSPGSPPPVEGTYVYISI